MHTLQALCAVRTAVLSPHAWKLANSLGTSTSCRGSNPERHNHGERALSPMGLVTIKLPQRPTLHSIPHHGIYLGLSQIIH